MAGRRAPWCGWRASRTRARTLDNAVARFAGSGMNLCTRRHDLHLQDSKRKFVEHVVSQGTGIHMIYRRTPRGNRGRIIAHRRTPSTAAA